MSGRRRGRGAAGLLSLVERLSARDVAVLKSLGRHRFQTTMQLEQFFFCDHATQLSGARACRRVLRQLEQRGLVTRLARPVGGLYGGSGSSVWHLAPLGTRALSLLAGDGVTTRVREPSVFFVAHALAVSQAHLQVQLAARAGRFGLDRVQIEQESWRSYLAASGSLEWLKPDLAAVTSSGTFEDHWFIEVDLGTEHLPTIIRKCQQYETYRRQGQEQATTGVFPVIIWAASTTARAAKLQRAISASRSLDQQLFRVCQLDRLEGVIAGAGP